jgi:hypothetical protein
MVSQKVAIMPEFLKNHEEHEVENKCWGLAVILPIKNGFFDEV